MSVTSHRAGEWLAVVGSEAWALIDLPDSSEKFAEIVSAIAAADLSRALDALTSAGVSSAPDFAMVALNEGQPRYLVRGSGTVVVRAGESSEAIVGYRSPTWADAYAGIDVTEISLRAPISGAAGGVVTGTARAGELTVALTSRRSLPVTETGASPSAGEVHADSEDSSYESMLYELLTANTTTRDALAQALTHTEEEPTGEETPLAAVAPVSAPPDQVRGETATWESTWQPQPASHVPAEPPAPPEVPTPPVSRPAGIIDALPWAPAAPSPPSPPPAPPAAPVTPSAAPAFFPSPTPSAPVPPMDPDITRVRSALLQHLTEPVQAGPLVWAVVCPDRHWSPPYAPHCRVCGLPVAEQQPQQVTRPTLGRLVVSTGAIVSLDRGVIFGRAPVTAVEGTGRPHLIKLDGSEVSRRHVEVRLEEWQVLIRDLGSGNGTTLALPGRPAERLRPQEEYALEPGSVIGVADLVTVTYEAS